MPCPICHKEHLESPPELIAVLAGTPKRLARLAARLTPRSSVARPAADKWSPKEIVCHLADCELVYGCRYRKIICEPNAKLLAFDQDAWARQLRYQAQLLKEALAAFSSLRAAHVSLFKSLPGECWDKAGEHSEYGIVRLRELAGHIAQHDVSHITQLERMCPPVKAAKKPAVKVKARPKARTRARR